MTLDYQSIMSSRPFRFLVGPEKKEYTMHAAAVAKLSDSLDRLIDGEMLEARESCATWEDMDEQTFLRFSQFAYKGDYTSALPVRVAADPPPAPKKEEPQARPPNQGGFGSFVPSHRATPTPLFGAQPTPPKKTKGEELWAAYTARRFLEPRTGLASAGGPARGETHEWTEVFLCHARLAVFADYHGIAALEKLAMHKLHWALTSSFELRVQRVGDVVALAKYVYDSTGPRDKTYGLRDLVLGFVVCNVETLMKGSSFQELIKDYGEFALDLVEYMTKRIE